MKNSTYRLTLSAFYAMMFVAVLGLIACGGGATQQAEGAAETETASEETNDPTAVEWTTESIAELKSKFTLDEASGYYTHNHWKNLPRRRTFTATVMAAPQPGYFIMSSNFYGNKAFKHVKVRAIIGEENKNQKKPEVLESNAVKTSEATNQTQTFEGGKVYEGISFAAYGDNGIFQAIAKTPLSEKIYVSFVVNDRKFTEYEQLSYDDHKALIESMQLSMVLRAEAQQ